jgi:hypothetical protein
MNKRVSEIPKINCSKHDEADSAESRNVEFAR